MKNHTVVISKSWPATPEREKFAEALAVELAANGVRTMLVPEANNLAEAHAALAALRALKKPAIFCGWLHPRALYWTLVYLGVPAACKRPAKESSPPICLNLAEIKSAEKALAELRKYFGGSFPGGAGKLLRFEAGAIKERWYPVIDRQRCQNCLACAEFCLFGVYSKTAEGRIQVAHPEACKPGCPACSRICPSQAIMFPLYEDDPAIAGAEDARIQPFDAETLAKIQKHRQKAVQKAPPCATGGGSTELAEVLSASAAPLKTLVKNCECKQKSAAAGDSTGLAVQGGNDGYFDQIIKDAITGS
jgi:NAD-dependent dihydropyrimidine dehydrogenase PreA subunit